MIEENLVLVAESRKSLREKIKESEAEKNTLLLTVIMEFPDKSKSYSAIMQKKEVA